MKLADVHPQAGRVLIVDDEPDICSSLKDLLEAHINGVEIDAVGSGKQALALLAKHRYDLIISDYRMPGMDGLEFLTKCREVAPDSPRILVTAYPALDAAMRAINEAQIQNFLTKPLVPEAFIKAINAALVKGRNARLHAVDRPL